MKIKQFNHLWTGQGQSFPRPPWIIEP